MSGAVIIPSRGRPGSIAELLVIFADAPVDLIVGVDSDDPELAAYEHLQALWPGAFRLEVGEPSRIGPIVNRLAVAAAADHEWVGFMGDDHRPRTLDWWRQIDVALSDSPGVAYGDDLLQGVNLATAVFISSELVTRLGYFQPPGLYHLFFDDFWMQLGRATRLVYLPQMVIEHLHPIAGKAEWDDSYKANNSRATWDHDHAEFQRYMAEDWPTERQKLVKVVR